MSEPTFIERLRYAAKQAPIDGQAGIIPGNADAEQVATITRGECIALADALERASEIESLRQELDLPPDITLTSVVREMKGEIARLVQKMRIQALENAAALSDSASRG